MGLLSPRSVLLGVALLLATTAADDTCRTPECMILAAGMATVMNQSADPCENFYDFACGNFHNTVSYSPCKVELNEVLYEDSAMQMVDKVEKRIFELLAVESRVTDSDPDIRDLYRLMRLFFSSCTEWLRLSEAEWTDQQELSASLMKGIFNHLMQSIEPSSGQQLPLESVVAAMVRSGGGGLITVELPWRFAEDVLQENWSLTKVSRAWVNMNRWRWPGEQPELYEKLTQYFQANGIDRSLSLNASRNVARGIVNDVSQQLTKERLAMGCYTAESSHAKLTVAELDALSQCASPNNSFSWTLFFEELLQTPIDADAFIETRDIQELITAMSYFKNQPVYSHGGESFSEYASYLIINWMISFGDFFPTELRKRWRNELPLKYAPGTESRPGRITGCMTRTKTLMRPIFEHMYRAAYHPKDFNSVKDLIQATKDASIDSVRRQSWIKSQEAVVNKIRWIQQSIGLDELTVKELKAFYNTTLTAFRAIGRASSEDRMAYSFGQLMSVVLCASARKNFDVMSGNSPVTIFTTVSSLDVNAYNYRENNRIVFPMAILEPPMYHQSYPGYINIGSLGTIIGHEIGHSFDEDGHQLNRWGAAEHFWDNATEEGYLERVECVRSCYGNYTLYPGGPRYNSTRTLGNDISDIIGLKAAYGALQTLKRQSGSDMQKLPNQQLGNLDQDQLFFVQAAQAWCIKSEKRALEEVFGSRYSRHSANHLRVTGMMQNSWEFARTFQCTPGQAMHPQREKCSFW